MTFSDRFYESPLEIVEREREIIFARIRADLEKLEKIDSKNSFSILFMWVDHNGESQVTGSGNPVILRQMLEKSLEKIQ